MLDFIAGRLTEFTDEDGEPRFMVMTSDGVTTSADTDSLLEIGAMLAQAADAARARVQEILELELPGSASSDPDSDTKDLDRFTARVVPAAAVTSRAPARR
ncbi:MAG: hypothetical protein IT348_11145 [Candidatus Eisenbacteria bacterium]|nr:hypothetical protein [Candidatus Eisenbacteria bacterium]